MNLEIFRRYEPMPIGEHKIYAVAIPIIIHSGLPHLLYEKRSPNLKTQPREVCFPGGRVEKNETPAMAAIRETSEELCIPAEAVELIGPTDYIVTPFNLILYPYVIRLNKDFKNIKCNPDEVMETFVVPIDYLLKANPIKRTVAIDWSMGDDFPYELIEGGKDYPWKRGGYDIYFYQYESYVIWGLTARITKSFIDAIRE